MPFKSISYCPCPNHLSPYPFLDVSYCTCHFISLEWQFRPFCLVNVPSVFKAHLRIVSYPGAIPGLAQPWQRTSPSLSSLIACVTLCNYTIFYVLTWSTNLLSWNIFFTVVIPMPRIKSRV